MDSLQCFDPSTKSCDENALGEPYQPTDVVFGVEVSLEEGVSCPTGKMNFEIKDNCGAYYNCSSGAPYLYQCPEGYFYDCWNQICSKTTSVYCCYEDERYTLPTGKTDLIDWDSREYTCKDNMKVAFERTDFKESYAICAGNLLYFGSCHPHSYCNLTGACFDPSVERCVSSLASRFSATTEKIIPSKSHSESTTEKMFTHTTSRNKNKPHKYKVTTTTQAPATETETESGYMEPSNAEWESSSPLPSDDKMPHEDDVTPTVQAPAGTNHINPIASSQCYDRFSALAVYDDCSKYVIYENSIPTTYSCVGNFKFDGFKKCCVKEHTSFTSACGGDPNKSFVNDVSCSDLELQNEEHPTKCNSYFSCDSFGVILEQTCPSGEVFDWQKKGCLDEGTAVTVPNCSSI